MILKYNQLTLPFRKNIIDEIRKIIYTHRNNTDKNYMLYEIKKIIEYNKPLYSRYTITHTNNQDHQITFHFFNSQDFILII